VAPCTTRLEHHVSLLREGCDTPTTWSRSGVRTGPRLARLGG
jgi:hypothetical protein